MIGEKECPEIVEPVAAAVDEAEAATVAVVRSGTD